MVDKDVIVDKIDMTGVALTWLTLLTRLISTEMAGTAAVGAVLAPAVATQVKF